MMRVTRVLAAGLMSAMALGAGGCDWQKFITFGMSSGWERPTNTAIQLAPQVRIAEVKPQPREGRALVTTAPTGGRVAYLLATPDAADRDGHHVFVDSGGRSWEVLGMPYPNTPIEALAWEGPASDSLAIERWKTPTEGVRVHIDMNSATVHLVTAIAREAPVPKTQPASAPARP